MVALEDRSLSSSGVALRYFYRSFAILATLISLESSVHAQQMADFSQVFGPPRLEELLGGQNQWQQARRPFGQVFYYPAGDYWRYFGPQYGSQGDNAAPFYYWNQQLLGFQPRPPSATTSGPLARPYLPKGWKSMPTAMPSQPSLLLEQGGRTSLPLGQKPVCHRRQSDGHMVCEFRGRSKRLFEVLWKIVMEGWDPSDEDGKDDDE